MASLIGIGLAALFFVLIIIAISVFIFVFWISMIIDCAKRKFKDDSGKILWILILIFLGVLGSAIYYFVVKKPENQNVVKKMAKESKKFAIVSLILGIFSFLLSFTIIFGVPLGLLSLIFSIISLKKESAKGMAISGLILGIMGILIPIFLVTIIM